MEDHVIQIGENSGYGYYQRYASSQTFQTSNAYIKYKIYCYNYHSNDDPNPFSSNSSRWVNTSTADITVDIFKTSSAITSQYIINTFVKIDGVDYSTHVAVTRDIPSPYYDPVDTTGANEYTRKTVTDNNYYTHYYVNADPDPMPSDPEWHAWYRRMVIPHNLDHTKTICIEARIVLLDPLTNEVVLDSGYNSFYRTFDPTPELNALSDITVSIDYITEQNISLQAVADLGDLKQPCAPYPIPPEWSTLWLMNHGYAYWWYTINGGEEWIAVGWKRYEVFESSSSSYGRGEGGDQHNTFYRYCYLDLNIRELSPNTTYNIIFATLAYDSTSDPPNIDFPPPDPENEPYEGGIFGNLGDDEDEGPDYHGLLGYKYSSTLTIKTEPVMEPLPFNISDTGLFRRISLYEADEETFETNGIGSLIDAVECTVTEEINGVFELEMVYPVDGLHFNDIDFNRLITANPNQYTNPQPFRIYAISKPHDGKVTVNAAHISYDLSNLTVAPFKSGSVQSVMAKLKYGNGGYADVYHRFQFWTDMSSSGELRTYTPMTIRSILGGGELSLLSIFGGEYEFNGYTVRLWKHRGTDKGVTIAYGKNLTSLKQDSNCNNMYTGVRPFWYKENDGTANTGLVTCGVINLLGTFNYTKILLLDLSSEFDEKPTEEELESYTKMFIDENNLTQPVVSLNVSFVQLSDSSEYADLKLLEEVKLGDKITVYFPKLNIYARGVECVKTVFNVLSQRYNSIELGTLQQTLAGTISNNTQMSKSSVSKMDVNQVISNIVDSGGTSSSNVGSTNYVVLDYSTTPARLLIMDQTALSNSTNIIKFSTDGLTHSTNGANGPFSTIMPIDCSSFNIGTVNCTQLNQTTANMEIKNDHILKIKRW